MQLQSFSLGQLNANCYLVWCEKTLEAIVIDPADQGDFITEQIVALDLLPQAIILTHGHFDHLLGLLELKLNFPQTPILMHQADLFLLKSAQQRAVYWLKMPVDPVPTPDKFVLNNDIITFGQEKLTIMHTPGHTPGSICLYNDQNIFTGDTLFKNAVGSTHLSYSNKLQMKNSLKKIRSLAKQRNLYAGHEQS